MGACEEKIVLTIERKNKIEKNYQKLLTYKKPCVILSSEQNSNDYHF